MTNDIKVIHTIEVKQGGKWIVRDSFESDIDIKTFRSSFVNERWNGERRYNKQYTKLGYYHTKTIVKFDENKRSVRKFIFPD